MGQGRHKNRFFLAVPLVALFALPSLAGTVFMAPEFPTRLEPGESYPESRFGKLPEKPGDRTFARSDGDDTGVTRRPAGLEIGRVKQSETSAPSGVTAPPLPMTLPPEPERDRNAELRLPPAETSVARRGVQEVALIAGDLGYFPKTVFVNRDVPVRLFVTGASKNTLCIMMDSFQVRRQVRSQKIEEITFTPSVPGKYRFYCPVNGMEGTLIVKELATPLSSS